jgi:ADP-heptose:LPS heptosyltransferase
MGYRLRALILLRWRNFAIAIQPTFSREFVGDLVLRSTNAPARIGYSGDTNNISVKQKTSTDLWYSKLIIGDPACMMELIINAQFVRELGQKDFVSDVPFIPKIEPSLLNSLPANLYIVIAPGASWQSKIWPLDQFAALVLQLNSTFDLHFVLCGDKNDRTLCESLAQKVNLHNLTNIAGQTNLIQLIEIIRGAILVVSNDSSPVHLAAATRTRAVCILGGGHFGRFLPYQVERSTPSPLPVALWSKMDCFGCRWRCKFAPQDGDVVPCVSSVALQEVIHSCRTLLVC